MYDLSLYDLFWMDRLGIVPIQYILNSLEMIIIG